MSVTQRTQRTIGVLMALFVASSCNLTPDVREGAAAMPAAVGGGGELYNRLGGEMGIRTVVTDFVGRVAKDTRINGYFLNSNVGVQRVIDCLVIQVGSLTGAGYPYPSGGCRDMKTVHTNMGVSKADFDDTAGHLVAALTAAGVSAADISTIVGAVAGTAPDIIEDPNNNKTVYQRVGRKPAIATVVNDFLGQVTSDPVLLPFFENLTIRQTNRLRSCLVRQVCGIDGPCRYGQEVFESTLDVNNNTMLDPNEICRDMAATHAGVTGTGGAGITINDFDALLAHLAMALSMAGVANTDRDAVMTTLDGMCPMIVAGGTGC
jgi:hemoglobin